VVILFIMGQLVGVIAMGVAIFWSSGLLDWWPAWAAIAVWLAFYAGEDIILLRLNPDLMAERMLPPKDAKAWDRAILSTLRLLQLARYILAGLDVRYNWTGGFPLAVQISGLLVCVLSYALLLWSMASNTYFSQVVRIQADRGHSVASQGPYRFVRHPAYVGMFLFELGLGALFASWPALLVGAVCSALVLLRTALEDRTLQADLPGYADYARQVRYRLLPGVW
jgi:protein-S-isoprenylcysteine O-methyltransferase Ste14